MNFLSPQLIIQYTSFLAPNQKSVIQIRIYFSTTHDLVFLSPQLNTIAQCLAPDLSHIHPHQPSTYLLLSHNCYSHLLSLLSNVQFLFLFLFLSAFILLLGIYC